MITFKAQHILNPAAEKRTFWRIFKPQLQLQIIAKRPDKHDLFQGSTSTKPCSQKKLIFWQNIKPQLQLRIIPKRYDQYDHIQS